MPVKFKLFVHIGYKQYHKNVCNLAYLSEQKERLIPSAVLFPVKQSSS